MRRTRVRHTRKKRGGGFFNGIKRLFGLGPRDQAQSQPAPVTPAPIKARRPAFANLNEPTNEELRQQEIQYEEEQEQLRAQQAKNAAIVETIRRQARERGAVIPGEQPGPVKKPTWRNRLKSGWSSFTKTIRNRLPGKRTVLPAPGTPPSPPEVTPPGTPPPVNEPIHTPTREEYLSSPQETVEDAYYRVVWYVKQRLNGRTHAELLPYLNRPKSMKATQADIDELKRRLEPIRDAVGNDQEYDRLITESFGSSIDEELDSWERGIPATKAERQRLCYGQICKIYVGTTEEQFAQGNVANRFPRFLGKLYSLTPKKLRNLSNIERSTCTTDTTGCILIVNPIGLTQEDYMIGPNDFTRLSPTLRLLAVSSDYLYSTPSTTVKYKIFPTLGYLHDAIAAGAILLVTPHLALDLMKNFPELYTLMFRSDRWTRMPHEFRVRMLALQYFVAIQMFNAELSEESLRQTFTQFPNPALNYVYTLDEPTRAELDDYFLAVQREFNVKPMPLNKYLNLLKPLANQQVKAAIQPRLPSANNVPNWGTTRRKSKSRRLIPRTIEEEANLTAALRRNAAKRLVENIRAGRSTLGPTPAELRVSANLSHPPATKSQRAELNRTLATAFNNTRRVRPSAYEPL